MPEGGRGGGGRAASRARSGSPGLGLVLGLGLPSLAAWVGLAAAGDLTRRVPLLFALYGAAFAGYAVLLAATRWGERLDRRALLAALALALAFRAVMLAAPPSLSADVYRYLWDGRVFAAGVNPFRYPPTAPELEPLRDEHHSAINHHQLPTIYPATDQLVFLAVARIWPTPAGMKLAMGLFDLATLAALAGLLGVLGLPPGRLLVHAWCPLPILELSGMGHVDAIGIAFLVAAILALERQRPRLALAALAAAILGKLMPVLLVPAFLARASRRAWWVLVLILAAGLLPFWHAGVDPTVALRTFAAIWRGNDVAFAWLLKLADGDLAAAKRFAAILTAAVALACLRRRASPAATALAVLTAALLLSPVLHPWYLTWLVPFLAVRPSASLVTWTGSVVFAYVAWTGFHAAGEYAVPLGVRALELGLPLATAAVGAAVQLRAMRPAPWREWRIDRSPI